MEVVLLMERKVTLKIVLCATVCEEALQGLGLGHPHLSCMELSLAAPALGLYYCSTGGVGWVVLR